MAAPTTAMDRDSVVDAVKLHGALQTAQGIATLGNDPLLQKEALDTMGKFLDAQPAHVPWSRRTDAPLWQLPVGELLRRTLQTAVDILNDLAAVATEASTLSMTQLRRRIFVAFTAPARRLYVGIWLVVLSFVLYFIDSAA